MQFKDLIPYGRNNAISRADLAQRAMSFGFVDEKCKDADRECRKLISQLRKTEVILANCEVGGYYRPDLNSKEDMDSIQDFIRQNEYRAMRISIMLRSARNLYEDYIHGRLNNE